MNLRDKRVPLPPPLERQLESMGFHQRLRNGVVREWFLEVTFGIEIRVRFNEWLDVEGGLAYLLTGSHLTPLKNIGTLVEIEMLAKLLGKESS